MEFVLFFIFLLLAIIHFNWVRGGTFGLIKSLPTTEEDELVLNPRKVDSAIIGFGLLLFSVFYLMRFDVLNIQLPSSVSLYLGWIIPSIFLLRAIGDFKYVGFFKKIKYTEFGRADTKFFSPLCLLIGILGILIQLLYQ